MSDTIKTDYADLLNTLDKMEHSFAYAVRRNELKRAQEVILRLEKENQELRLSIAKTNVASAPAPTARRAFQK